MSSSRRTRNGVPLRAPAAPGSRGTARLGRVAQRSRAAPSARRRGRAQSVFSFVAANGVLPGGPERKHFGFGSFDMNRTTTAGLFSSTARVPDRVPGSIGPMLRKLGTQRSSARRHGARRGSTAWQTGSGRVLRMQNPMVNTNTLALRAQQRGISLPIGLLVPPNIAGESLATQLDDPRRGIPSVLVLGNPSATRQRRSSRRSPDRHPSRLHVRLLARMVSRRPVRSRCQMVARWSCGGGRVSRENRSHRSFRLSRIDRHTVSRSRRVRGPELTRTLPIRDQAAHPRVEWLQGDLASPRDAALLVDGVDAVVHLAWTNTPLTSNAHLPSDASANLLPTLTLLEAVRALPRRLHVVFASSGGAVYGLARDGRPFSESDLCRPESSYGIQKLAVEQYLRMGATRGWFTATALRIGNPYGVLLPPERLQGFIGTALAQLQAGEPDPALRKPGERARLRPCARRMPRDRGSARRTLRVRPRQRRKRAGPLRRGHPRPDRGDSGRMPEVRVESSAAADDLPSWVVLDIARARDTLGWTPDEPADGVGQLLARTA